MISRRAILLAPFAAIDLSEWVAADGSAFWLRNFADQRLNAATVRTTIETAWPI